MVHISIATHAIAIISIITFKDIYFKIILYDYVICMYNVDYIKCNMHVIILIATVSTVCMNIHT